MMPRAPGMIHRGRALTPPMHARSIVALSFVSLAACRGPAGPAGPAGVADLDDESAAAAPGEPIALTYLGVAGWQLDAAGKTILLDPYFTRPDLDADAPIAPDPTAIAAHAPPRADLIMIGHSHIDHLLDAPSVALATGAQLMGSLSTTRVGRASGVPDDHLLPIKGGEDYAMDGYSVRVIPSLHSAIGDKHILGGEIPAAPALPMRFGDYAEGGTFAYLVRIAGHQILFFSTANFIERELEGLRPDIAVIATGLRGQIHDYTCRLLRVLGHPPLVYATHFDDWQGPPVDEPPSADLQAFIAEVEACAPGTRVILPQHFVRMTAP